MNPIENEPKRLRSLLEALVDGAPVFGLNENRIGMLIRRAGVCPNSNVVGNWNPPKLQMTSDMSRRFGNTRELQNNNKSNKVSFKSLAFILTKFLSMLNKRNNLLQHIF